MRLKALAAATFPFLLPNLALHAGVPDPSLDALVAKSDRIVAGSVAIGETSRQNVVINSEGDTASFVVTYLNITPTEHLKGTGVSSLTVRLLGGFIDGYAIVDVDGPRISHGENVVLFLAESGTARTGEPDEAVFYLPYAKFGKFAIETRNGTPVVTRPHSMGSLHVPAGPDVGDRWIDYAKFKQLLQTSAARAEE